MGIRQTKSASQLLAELEMFSIPENRLGMARFGIDVSSALGVLVPNIRSVGKSVVKNHVLAEELWQTGIHEARILASLIDIPAEVTRDQMDRWANDFNSWDVCDQVCGNLFDRVIFAERAISDWHQDEREFVKRAAFAMIAWRAVHLKNAPDALFEAYLPLIEAASNDNRNFVRKAVNWALRQIGKRNIVLHISALNVASRLAASSDGASRWIGSNAVRELDNAALVARLG